MLLKSTENLKSLINSTDDEVASIYLPLDGPSPEGREKNRIRLDNALSGLKHMLEECDQLDEDKADAIYNGAAATLQQDDDWDLHGSTIVVSATHDTVTCQYLPKKVDARVVIDSRFYLVPAIMASHGRLQIRVLNMSQDKAELVSLTGMGVETKTLDDTGVEGMPPAEDDRSDQLQFHGVDVPGGGQAAIFHGQGQDEHAAEERLRRWVKHVADAVHDELYESDIPLVFAGPDRLFGVYKEHNTYSGFVEDVHVNSDSPDGLDDERVKEVYRIASEYVAKNDEEYCTYVLSKESHGDGSTDLADLAESVALGRIETLLVADELDNSAGSHDLIRGMEEDEAQLNKVISDAIMMGAKVRCVAPDQLPDGVKIAASYRF